MSGNGALCLTAAGALLVIVECNRPGKILPGACGLFLMLAGIDRLRVFTSWGDRSVWIGLTGLALIAVLRWRLLYGLPGVLGTALLTIAFTRLAKTAAGELSPRLASGCGLLLGLVGSWLMMIAGHARRAKAGHRRASAGQAQAGALEYWGVD